jgi:hypothetical protein
MDKKVFNLIVSIVKKNRTWLRDIFYEKFTLVLNGNVQFYNYLIYIHTYIHVKVHNKIVDEISKGGR